MRNYYLASSIVALLAIGCTALLAQTNLSGSDYADSGAEFHEDYVPNQATAVAIAEAVALGQLDDRQLAQILPFTAILDGEVWLLTSQIGLGGDAQGSGGFRGVEMVIDRNTGEILRYGYYPYD